MFEKVASLEAENSQLREQLHQATAAVARATERALTAEEAAAAQASTQACHQSGPQGPGSTGEEGEAEGGGDRLEDLSRPQLLARLLALQQEVAGIQEQRRRAHNQAVEMRGAVRVFVRVRPPAPNQSSSAVRTLPDGSTVGVSSGSQETLFSFGRVFGPSASQQQVFGEVQELVQSALDGYHVCIASYGQTGSGKTHNMTGDGTPDGKGLIPRAVEKLLDAGQRLGLQGWAFTMSASCIELYNNSLRDLLEPGSRDITDINAIKHDQNGGSHTVVQGVSQVSLTSVPQALALLTKAANARASSATAMNATSSRSHSVFVLNITGNHAGSSSRLTGALCLVDLAGSERLDRSKAEGACKAEACSINSTLASLGDLFEALARRQQHIPYRNSKLTYLLKPCLSPGGKVLFMCHVGPEDASAYESLTTLRFATKVAGTELGAPARRAAVLGMAAPAQQPVLVPDSQQPLPSQRSRSTARQDSARSSCGSLQTARSQRPCPGDQALRGQEGPKGCVGLGRPASEGLMASLENTLPDTAARLPWSGVEAGGGGMPGGQQHITSTFSVTSVQPVPRLPLPLPAASRGGPQPVVASCGAVSRCTTQQQQQPSVTGVTLAQEAAWEEASTPSGVSAAKRLPGTLDGTQRVVLRPQQHRPLTAQPVPRAAGPLVVLTHGLEGTNMPHRYMDADSMASSPTHGGAMEESAEQVDLRAALQRKRQMQANQRDSDGSTGATNSAGRAGTLGMDFSRRKHTKRGAWH
ncbi:P-loop containing nucleoside triphosphate hydrolase protein [Haematococcus lacustris]